MAAEHALGMQFYHGTRSELKPGDTVNPNHQFPMGHGAVSDFVWSTPNVSDASMYGGNVYQVEPTGLHEPYKMNVRTPRGTTELYEDKSRWVTMAPMKVVRKAPRGGA